MLWAQTLNTLKASSSFLLPAEEALCLHPTSQCPAALSREGSVLPRLPPPSPPQNPPRKNEAVTSHPLLISL